MDNEKIRILAIDDNPDNLITIKALIGEIYPDAKVITATSGKEGLELASVENPDVILLDIVMPGMDGFEVCVKLKSDKILCDTPVIFVTANKDDKKTRIRALEVGAEAFLAKPIDESELKAQIRAMLKIKTANIKKLDENVRLKALVDERTIELRRTYSATLNLLEDLKNENEARRKTEEHLRESEEKYRLLVENSPNGIAIYQDGKFVYVNKSGLKMLGANNESDLIGMSVFSVVHPDSMDEVIDRVTQISLGKQVLPIEEKLIRQDGSVFVAEVTTIGTTFNGRSAGQVIVTDITDRKTASQKLRESEEKFRDMADLLPQVVFEMNLDGYVTYVNQQAQAVFGYTTDELIGLYSLELHVPEERERVVYSIEQKLAGLRPDYKEFRMLRKDGSEFPTLISINIIVKNNKPVGLRGVLTDITEQKQAQNALLESEALYRAIIDASPDYITITDVEGRLVKASPSVLARHGFKNESEVLGRKISEFVAEEDRERMLHDFYLRIHGTKTGPNEYKAILADGSLFDIEVNGGVIKNAQGEVVKFVSIARDITERKAIQDALIESEDRYNNFINNNVDMIFVKDESCRYLIVNDSMAAFFGKAKEDILYKTDKELFDKEQAYPCSLSDLKTLEAQCGLVFEETLGDRIYETIKFPMQLKNKQIGIGGIMRDITERKLAEEKLNYVTRLYALLSQINQAIVRTRNVDELLAKICQLAIDFGQFQMAWVGVYNPEDGLVKPMTFAGHNDGYLDNLIISPNNPPFGNGPTGRAFADDEMVFCNDIATDPIMKPWKDEALKRGYKSSFSTPFSRKGIPFGTITLYASEINFFDEEEQKLLSEVVDDIVYAIDAIDSEQERKSAEIALIESEAKYREFVENSPEAIAIYSDGIVKYVNLECLRLMRATSKNQLVGLSVIDFIHPDNRQIVLERMKKVAAGEVNVSLQTVEEKYIRLDGTPIYVEVKVMPLMLDGKPAFQLTARDITDRKVIELALEKSRTELKTIYDYAPVMMCVVDENGCIQFANNAFTTLVGIHKDIMEGVPVGGVIGCMNSLNDPRGCGHGVNCKKCNLRLAMEKTYRTGIGLQNVEYHSTLNIGGETKEVFLLGSTAIIEIPGQRSLLLCLHDITDRKLAEEALQKSEMLLRTFIDNSPFEIWARDNESIGILENKKLVDHYGSIVGHAPNSNPGIDKETLHLWEKNNARVLSGEIIDEEHEFTVNGEPRMFQQIVFPIHVNSKLIGIAGFNIDITDRKLAEEKNHENSLKLEMAMEVANMAWWEMNLKTGHVAFGKRKADMIGFPAEKFAHYEDFMALVHPEDHEKSMEAMRNHIYGSADKYEIEYRIQTSAGGNRWFYDIGSISKRDVDGNPLIVSGLVLDITDRKNAERELADQKRFFEQMFMQSSLSTQILDREGWCERINPKLTKIFGVEASDIEGHVYNIFNDQEIKQKGIVPKLNRVFREGKTVEWEVFFDIAVAAESQNVKIKHARRAWFSNWAYPIKDQNGKISHVIIQHTDITDKKKSEQALNESQEQLKKFAAHLQNVREEERVLLAREIHDQLGQILVAVKIDMGMLKQKVLKDIDKKQSQELHTKFDNLSALIDNTIKTARKIMTDLRPEVLDMIGFVETVRQHLNNFQERHHIPCNLVTTDSHLELSTQQSVALFRIIQEALNNISKHAKATEVNVIVNKHDKELILEVADNGVGFDQTQKKNHDSYGLIGMNERVFLLDGELLIKSRPGKGTTVQVVIPFAGK